MLSLRVLIAAVIIAAGTSCYAQDDDGPSLKPSSEKEMKERITRAKKKVGWPDPEIGKGALDEIEAAKYAEMKHLFKRPHFNKPTPEFEEQWKKLASYPIPEWMLDPSECRHRTCHPASTPESGKTPAFSTALQTPGLAC